MTYDDYLANVTKAIKDHPSWRIGQAAFNVLYVYRPDLSEQVRATPLDPFHQSTHLEEFYSWVRDQWEKPNETITH